VLGGALIGAAEAVPGVSGGTLALVVGLYDRLIGAADTVVRAAVALVPGRGEPGQARRLLAEVPWALIVPVLVGMLSALVLGARLLEPLVANQPVLTRAAFFGLVAASIVVPLRMVGGLRAARDLLWLVLAIAVAFALVSLPPAETTDPSLLLVLLAASVAVCALVLPGVSGSFFLLSVGLYSATLSALNDRNLTYLAAFALGAVLGLGTVVRGVRWLLMHRRRPTLLVMTGLMIGSLRALWPWQDDDRGLQAPGDDLVTALVIALAAAVFVGLLIAGDARLTRRRAETEPVGSAR